MTLFIKEVETSISFTALSAGTYSAEVGMRNSVTAQSVGTQTYGSISN